MLRTMTSFLKYPLLRILLPSLHRVLKGPPPPDLMQTAAEHYPTLERMWAHMHQQREETSVAST